MSEALWLLDGALLGGVWFWERFHFVRVIDFDEDLCIEFVFWFLGGVVWLSWLRTLLGLRAAEDFTFWVDYFSLSILELSWSEYWRSCKNSWLWFRPLVTVFWSCTCFSYSWISSSCSTKFVCVFWKLMTFPSPVFASGSNASLVFVGAILTLCCSGSGL